MPVVAEQSADGHLLARHGGVQGQIVGVMAVCMTYAELPHVGYVGGSTIRESEQTALYLGGAVRPLISVDTVHSHGYVISILHLGQGDRYRTHGHGGLGTVGGLQVIGSGRRQSKLAALLQQAYRIDAVSFLK